MLELFSENIKHKYFKFKANLENPDTRQCPKCDFSQVGTATKPAMTCQKCSYQYCFHHGDAHPNSTCEVYERKNLVEEKKSAAAIAKDCKACPRCTAPIFKNGGCNHMKCVHCQCSFCWLCMQEIEDKELPSHYKFNARNPGNPCSGKQFGETNTLIDLTGWRRTLFFTVFCGWLLFFFLVSFFSSSWSSCSSFTVFRHCHCKVRVSGAWSLTFMDIFFG